MAQSVTVRAVDPLRAGQRVVVIGAGPAGLTAAYLLSKQPGIDVTVLEADVLVWGIPCTEIRAEWAAQRIHGLSLARAIITATSLNKRQTTIKSLIDEFRYPRLGPGQVWEACRDRVRELGNRVLMGHRATAVHS